jgi:hypothetical protein
MRERMWFADWMRDQVVALRKLGFQVADNVPATTLPELIVYARTHPGRLTG